jgi:ElaB/YqjD/DUF883 family membrane-anchored ribosome-binding protein
MATETKAKAEELANDTKAKAEDLASDAKSKAEDLAGEAKSKAGELAGQAKDAAYGMAESGRDSAAGALDSAADRIEDRVASSDGMPAAAAEKAAQGMHAAAGYLKEHETAEVWDDIEQYVKTHPMQSVALAIAGGVVIGRILR